MISILIPSIPYCWSCIPFLEHPKIVFQFTIFVEHIMPFYFQFLLVEINRRVDKGEVFFYFLFLKVNHLYLNLREIIDVALYDHQSAPESVIASYFVVIHITFPIDVILSLTAYLC